MADLSYRVDVNVRSAERNLQTLRNSVNNASQSFERLKSVIGGLALGATVASAFRLANSINDLSAATGLATQQVVGFSQAVQRNGGSMQVGQQAILRFTQSLGAAREGNASAIQQFERLGISLNELKLTSDQDILRLTIDRLGTVSDRATRTRRSVELFGRSFAGIDVAGVNRELDRFLDRAGISASAIENAGIVNQRLTDAMVSLQLAILQALEPLSKFAEFLTRNQEAIDKWISAIVNVVTVLGGLFILNRLLGPLTKFIDDLVRGRTTIRSVTGSLLGFTGVLSEARDGVKLIAAGLGGLTTILTMSGGLLSNLKLLLGAAVSGFVRLIPLVGAVTGAFFILNSAVDLLTGKSLVTWIDDASLGLERFVTDRFPKIANAINSLNDSLGLAPSPLTRLEAIDTIEQRVNRLRTEQEQFAQSLAQGLGSLGADQIEELERQVERYRIQQELLVSQLERLGTVPNQVHRETIANLNRLLEGVKKQQEQINTTLEQERQRREEIKQQIQELVDLETRNTQRILSQYREVNNEFVERFRLQTRGINLTEEQRLKIETLADFEANYLRTVAPLQQRLQELKESQLEADRALIPVLETQLALLQSTYEDTLPSVQEMIQERLRELRIRQEQLDIEQQLLETQRASEDAIRRAVDFQERMADSVRDARFEFDKLNMSQLEQDLADISFRIERDLQRQIQELRKLDTGDNTALINEQIDQITQSARQAIEIQEELARKSYEHQRSFATGWRDAFRDYRENATNAARQAERIFSTVTRNMEDAIVNFARTGKFQFRDFANVVLEELLRIQIQKTFANMIGGGGGGSGVLGSLFAGFFATGGQIPPGRFGIVGESGPELVQGPADVTPLGATQVTYNINALDAGSFKQMLARDPSFLFAVTEQGRRRAPITRR